MTRLSTYVLFCLLALSSVAWGAAPTYYWVGGNGTVAWDDGSTWNTTKGGGGTSRVALTNDVLIIDGTDLGSGATGALTITGVTTQTIGSLQVIGNASTTLQSGAAAVLTLSGGGTALQIDAGSTLIFDATIAANIITMNLPSGSTGTISGNLTLQGSVASTAHKLTGVGTSAITFQNGSIFTAGTNFSSNPFGTTNLNSVSFASGSTYISIAGSNPFGAGQPSTVVVFQTGSLFKIVGSSTPAFSGRTYANLELNSPATVITTTGGSKVTLDNLTITAGTLNFNMTGIPGHSIKGNITVAPGATLNFAPASAGTVNLNGSSIQSIGGAGTISNTALSTIVLNNSNGLTVNTNLSLTGALTLTSGKITLGSNTLTTASAITGASLSNYVVTNSTGALIQTLIASGTKSFPIGTATTYAPVSITNNDGASSDNYSASVAPDASGSNSGSDRVQLAWTVGRTGATAYTPAFQWPGTAEGANFTANRATYSNLFSGIPSSSASVAATLSGADPYTLTATATANTNTVFGIGQNAAALPVELTSLAATSRNGSVNISWSTATEKNNSGFSIERKGVDAKWNTLGFVKGHGTSNTQNSYSYTDAVTSGGTYSYRLKQVDNDGKYEYSKEVETAVALLASDYTMAQNYPNPFNPTTNIRFALKNTQYASLKVYNLIGQEVATLFEGTAVGGQITNVTFDASHLTSGTYIYQLKSAERTEVKRMTLVK